MSRNQKILMVWLMGALTVVSVGSFFDIHVLMVTGAASAGCTFCNLMNSH